METPAKLSFLHKMDFCDQLNLISNPSSLTILNRQEIIKDYGQAVRISELIAGIYEITEDS